MTELVQPIKRVEQYLYALCVLDFSNIPVPRSRLEIFTHAMITGEIPEIAPETREEEYMVAIIKGDVANLPTPKSRADHLLYRICLGETEIRDIELETRYEMLLAYLAEHGGTDLEYALINFTKAFETLYNTVEMPVKSAILTGQTLVNTLLYEHTDLLAGAKRNGNTFTLDKSQKWSRVHFLSTNPLWEENEIYTTILYDVVGDVSNLQMRSQNGNVIDTIPFTNNKAVFVMGTVRDFDKRRAYIESTVSNESGVISFKAVVLKGDYSNIDIPFFTGMQSVKMPVLTATGKNLFDKTKIIFDKLIDWNTGNISDDSATNITDFIKVIPNTQYTMSFNFEISAWTRAFGFTEPKHDKYATDVNGASDKCYFDSASKTITFTTSPTTKYLLFSFGKGVEESFQLEQGSTATSYEPYKSNILTVNEDVELGSVGEIKDELNLLTGEITSYSYNYTITGDEPWADWAIDLGEYVTFYFYYKNSNMPNIPYEKVGKGICNKFEVVGNVYNSQQRAIGIGTHYISLGIKFSELNITSDSTRSERVNALKTWLKNNNVEVRLPYAQEVVKTVDLSIVDQDDQPTQLKTFNDVTHIETQADSVLPTVILEYGTKNEEVLAALSQDHEEVADAQAALSDAIDSQSDEVETTMMALTEVYEGRNEE